MANEPDLLYIPDGAYDRRPTMTLRAAALAAMTEPQPRLRDWAYDAAVSALASLAQHKGVLRLMDADERDAVLDEMASAIRATVTPRLAPARDALNQLRDPMRAAYDTGIRLHEALGIRYPLKGFLTPGDMDRLNTAEAAIRGMVGGEPVEPAPTLRDRLAVIAGAGFLREAG